MSTINDAEMEDASLEEIPAPSSPQLKPWDPMVTYLPQMWLISGKRPTRALEDLLMVKSSIDAHWWKLVSEFSMALCENNSKAMESIKEAKAVCACSIQEAEDCCSVREVEARRVS